MGGSYYSADVSSTMKSAARAAGYTSSFTYDTDIKSGKTALEIHESLDPSTMKGGIRESRDPDADRESRAMVVGLDVTGSMSNVPKLVLDKIPALIGTVIKNTGIANPQVCFSAVGDAYCDRVPFQVGQFESGNEMESNLANFYLEGGGGGNGFESYDLWLYFLARCTSIDCFEKRGDKGYAFLIQDEPPPPYLDKSHVKAVFGHTIEANVPLTTLIDEASEKWEIFILRPAQTSYGRNASVTAEWEALFPQHIIPIPNVDTICETIALTIATFEGVDLDDVAKGLVDGGADKSSVDAAKGAIVAYTAKSGLVTTKKAAVTGDLALATGKKLKRL